MYLLPSLQLQDCRRCSNLHESKSTIFIEAHTCLRCTILEQIALMASVASRLYSIFLLHSLVRHLMHTYIQLHALHSPLILMQGLNPTPKVKRRSNRIMQDDETPAAQPPAGAIDNEVSLPASALDASDAASDPASEIPAAVATTAADDAFPPASSAPAANPQLSAKTSPQSCQSPTTSHQTDAVRDTVQSAELSGTQALLQLSQRL